MILDALFAKPSGERRQQFFGSSNAATWLINSMGGNPSAAGPRVDERSALAMPTVYACIRVLAESVAQLPLVLYRQTGRRREPATDHSLYHLLSSHPNPEHTSFVFRELLMAHLGAWGNSYILVNRRRGRDIGELWPLRPDQVKVCRIRNKKTFSLQPESGPEVDLSGAEVVHIPGIGYDGLMGWSPIRMHREAIGWGLATQDYSSRFFGNGAQPQGVLTHPGNVLEPDKVRESWIKRNSDEQKLGVAVLTNGMKYEQIGIAPDDAQFVQTRGLQIADICRIFNVPPMLVQDYGRATWNNSEHADLAFVKHTLVPWLVRIESALNTGLLSDLEQKTMFFKFKVQGLLRGDNAGRANFYNLGVTGGWMTRNEVRQLEDLDPLDGLDEPLTPVSTAQPAGEPKKADPTKPATDDDEDKEGDEQDRAIALAAASRVLGKELGELRRLRVSSADHADWLDAVNGFYAEHRKYLMQALALPDGQARAFLDARWRDLQSPETVKSTLQQWAEAGPHGLLEALRHA